ncbi:MAG: GGDEF domain-containing protein [Steroidobacteraceae bacterium]
MRKFWSRLPLERFGPGGVFAAAALAWLVCLVGFSVSMRPAMRAELLRDSEQVLQRVARERPAVATAQQLRSWVLERAEREAWSAWELRDAQGVVLAAMQAPLPTSLLLHLLRGATASPAVDLAILSQGVTIGHLNLSASTQRVDGLALRIWSHAATALSLLAVLVVAAQLLSLAGMRRVLHELRGQVLALATRRFLDLREPAWRPLLPMSQAINVLVGRVRTLLQESEQEVEAIRYRVQHDHMTQLASREVFMDQLRESLQQQNPGAVVLIHVLDVEALNRRQGRKLTDDFLMAVATTLRARLLGSLHAEHGVAARLNGTDFALLLPGASAQQVKRIMDAVRNDLQRLFQEGLTDVPSAAAVGGTTYDHDEQIADVLSRADFLLGVAISGRGSTTMLRHLGHHFQFGIAQWSAVIEGALATGRVKLASRSIVDAQGAELFEDLAPQLIEPDGTVLGFEELLPPAMRTGRILEVVLRTVDLALGSLGSRPQARCRVEVPAQCLEHPIFQRQLAQLLSRHAAVASRLGVGISVSKRMPALGELRELLQQHGCAMGLVDVDPELSLLPLLESDSVRYVKLAPGMTRGIASDDRRYGAIRLLCRMGRRLGFEVFGGAVTGGGEQSLLFAAGVRGAARYTSAVDEEVQSLMRRQAAV